MAEENKNNVSEYDLGKKDTNTLVFDVTNGTMDVYDLLETNRSDIAVVKINRLIEYGEISKEMVAEKYSEVAGNITNKDLALMALDSVFLLLAQQVIAKPNGIVIDLSTGLIDEELSHKQAEELGISDSEYSYANISKEEIVLASIERSLQKYKENREVRREGIEIKGNNSNYYRSRTAFDTALDEYKRNNTYTKRQQELDKKAFEEHNYDEAVQEGIFDAKKKVIETDPSLIMLIDLINKTNKSKGTPAFNVQLAKLSKYIEQDPKRREIFSQIVDENREVLPQYQDIEKEYRDNLGIKVFFEKTQYLTEEDIQYLSKSDKKELYMNFVASIKQLGPNNKFNSQIIKNMKIIFPEISGILKDNKKIDLTKLLEFTKDVLELDKPLDSKGFSKLIKACQQELLNRQYHESQQNKKIDLKIENLSRENKIPDEEINKAFEENAIELHVDLNAVLQEDDKKTDDERYFENSKIVKFSGRDAGELKKKYKRFNSVSWISEKQTAVKLSFLSLVTLKNNLKTLSENNPFYAQKLAEVENRIEEFKSSNTGIDFEQYLGKNGGILDREKKEINNYEQSKITEKVLYDFITDEASVKSRDDYDKLKKEDKQEYLLNTLALYPYMNTSIGKFIARRLEIIDTEENGLVSLVKTTKETKNDKTVEEPETLLVPEINKDKIVEEYNKTSSHKFESFEELMQYTEVKKMEYVSDKLEEYSKLHEQDFFQLTGTDYVERSDEIERIRMDFNLRQRDMSNAGEKNSESKDKSVEGNSSKSSKISEQEEERAESFSEINNQTALVDIEKPSFFGRLKGIFSMLTNLTARVKDVFINNSKESAEENRTEDNTDSRDSYQIFERIDVNVLDAVHKTELTERNASQDSKEDKNQIEFGD